MLKKLIIPIIATLAIIEYARNRHKKNIPLIGDKAPAFTANTTKGHIRFPKDYKGYWTIFFSHPADFTPVCTTEFMVFESMKKEFEKRNTKLLGLSVDTVTSHIAWLKNIKEKIKYNELSDIDVEFPLIDDYKQTIARKYGMIQPSSDDTKTVRAVFIIDPKGIIRAIQYYPQTNGRNIGEILRILTAMQTSDEFGIATPANWEDGDEVIIPAPTTKEEAIKRLESMEDTKCYDWFLCFKKLPNSKNEEKITCEFEENNLN